MTENKQIVCIGGGHGLGQLLSVLSSLANIDLTGIVTTTDNGGSTGRLRDNSDTIAWGDIRYCLSKLSQKSSIQSLLFEHRFEDLGELSGHSLGNLMFCAIDGLCLKPTDSVKVMTKFLNIDVNILPMSDQPTHLISESINNIKFIGETSVDSHMQENISKLSLEPMVTPSQVVIQSIRQADTLFLGPGSFFTSTLPSLLMPEVITALNSNHKLNIFLLMNVKKEFNNQCDSIDFQLQFIKNLGIKKEINIVVPSHRKSEILACSFPCIHADIPADIFGRHESEALKSFLSSIVFSD